ncbi:MAG: NAD-dependent epimerase/dehydratase family protein [Verrucomicrobiales bacterium]
MTILIAGCGYLGKRAGRLLRECGCGIIALSHSEEGAAALRQEGWDARACDIGVSGSLAGLPAVDAIVHTAASGRSGAEGYRHVYLRGCRNLLEAFPNRRLLFSSSTSVYGQIDGSWVTEDSPAEPDRETGKILLEAEHLVLEAGGTVLRLAGIYGPGRSVLLKQFLLSLAQIDVRREAPATPDGRWINQIHRDDAAAAIIHLLNRSEASGVFNVADSRPMTQREIYAELARRFQRQLPPERPPVIESKRGWTHKRVDNARLRATGWSPRFSSWFDAIDGDKGFVGSILSQTTL